MRITFRIEIQRHAATNTTRSGFEMNGGVKPHELKIDPGLYSGVGIR